MQAMSIEELNSACTKILENAAELVDEAELLLAHDHYARAFALAHLACEEIAKPPVLHTVAVRLAMDASIDWKGLGKRLNYHKAKIEGGILVEHLRYPRARDESRIDELLRQLTDSAKQNALKNRSLYTSLDAGVATKPSEIITQPIATEIVQCARTRLDFARQAELTLQSGLGRTEAELRQSLRTRKLDTWVRHVEQIMGAADASGSPLTSASLRALLSDPDI